jgi:hypothetical protein
LTGTAQAQPRRQDRFRLATQRRFALIQFLFSKKEISNAIISRRTMLTGATALTGIAVGWDNGLMDA